MLELLFTDEGTEVQRTRLLPKSQGCWEVEEDYEDKLV